MFFFPARNRPWEHSTNALRLELAELVINWQQRLALMGDPRCDDGDMVVAAHLLGVARFAGLAVTQ